MRRPASLQAQRLAASGVAQPLELYRLDDEQGAQSMSHAEKLERLKFDARQAMIEYGIACRKDDQEGIRASTTAAVAAIDALALLAQQPEAVGWQPIETAPKGGARQLKRDILYIVHKFAAMEPEKEGPGSDEEDESWNSWYVAAFDLMGSEIGDALDAALAAPEASEPVLPNPGSPEASAMMDSVLAEYNNPSNPKNAARAGWVAAMRWLAAPPAAGERGAVPAILFDGFLVYQHLSEQAVNRTSHENVSDVLDAAVKAIRHHGIEEGAKHG
jgi:hypothetical protein